MGDRLGTPGVVGFLFWVFKPHRIIFLYLHILEPPKASVIEKVKPHRARILFWNWVKTCPKRFALPSFVYLIPIYGSSGTCLQKNEQNRSKIDDFVTQKYSVVEKIKPRRARITFVNDNFSNNHCSKQNPHTCIGHSNCSPNCVYCIFGIWNCLRNINKNCKTSLF